MSAAWLLSGLSVALIRFLGATGFEPPPPNAGFDYQIGSGYEPPAGVTVVARDWFLDEPLSAGYSICYVNAFQTQDDEDDVDRPDERSNWPPALVLSELGDDPNWGGEYLVDISTAETRAAAFAHVEPMIDVCAARGFDAVEFDNLDSWTRFDDTALRGEVPFGRTDAIAYAELLVDHAHASGLAVGQKNTLELGADVSLDVIGFDFAVVEECGAYDECDAYVDIFGEHVIDIEYTAEGFDHACASVGATVSVVRRDVEVTAPGSVTYVYDSC